MKYTKKDLENKFGFDRHALKKLEKNNELQPYTDQNGHTYYTEEQVKLLNDRSHGRLMKFGNNWINFGNVPKAITSDELLWNKAAELRSKVPFHYESNDGILVIEGINKSIVTVSFNNQTKTISKGSLKKCNLKEFLGIYSSDFKYPVGYHFMHGATNITFIDQIRNPKTGRKAYRYKCNRCGQEGTADEYNLTDKGVCKICSNKEIIVGINDLATTDSWMVPYFVDTSLTKSISSGSTIRVLVKCPYCGKIKKMKPDTLKRTHSIGCTCGDGFSYPAKFMHNVLEQLVIKDQIQSFKTEFSAPWLGKRRFDFMVLMPDKKFFIEIDGGLGHGNKVIDSSVSPETTLKIDSEKDRLANEHNFQVIRIRALESNCIYMKQSISKGLDGIFDLRDIEWVKADKFAVSNLTREVCKYYESHKPISTKSVGKHFHLSSGTVLRYIHIGEKFQWCKYDYDSLNKRRTEYQRREKEAKLKQVCEFYKNNRPILAYEIAKHFGYYPSTVLNYLKEGEKLGYPAYDTNYAEERNKEQIRTIQGHERKTAVIIVDSENNVIEEFESLKMAADKLGVSSSAVYSWCKRRGNCKDKKLRFKSDMQSLNLAPLNTHPSDNPD
ncbi:hypothetical protein ACTNEN_06275 [Oribacterium sp. HCP28S3_H8]|uniref:hypothetical protein n=1 Tax=Oribacterium sp. HCP28S3_H8 TaxID=3438945 RepID=UPI003F8CC453